MKAQTLGILVLITTLLLVSIQIGSGEELLNIHNYIKKSDDPRWNSKNICLVGCSTPQNPDECECATVYEITPKDLIGSKGIKLDYNNFWATFRSEDNMSLTDSVNQNSDWKNMWLWINVSKVGHNIEYDGNYYVCGKGYDEYDEKWYDETCYNDTIIKDETYIYEDWEPFKFDKSILSKDIKLGITGQKNLGANVDHVLNFKVNNQNYALQNYDWWNSTWGKRRNITITNNEGYAKSNELFYIYEISGTYPNSCENEARLIDLSDNSTKTFDVLENTSTTCKIAFIADLSASSSKTYGFYYNTTVPVSAVESDILYFYDDFNDSTKTGGIGSKGFQILDFTDYNDAPVNNIITSGTEKLLSLQESGSDVTTTSIHDLGGSIPIGTDTTMWFVFEANNVDGATNHGMGLFSGSDNSWYAFNPGMFYVDNWGIHWRTKDVVEGTQSGSVCDNCYTSDDNRAFQMKIDTASNTLDFEVYDETGSSLGDVHKTGFDPNTFGNITFLISGVQNEHIDIDRWAIANTEFTFWISRSKIVVGSEEIYVDPNTPPTIISITLISDDELNNTQSDLIGDYVYSDPDSDPQVSNETMWFKNGVDQSGLTDLMSVDSSYTSKGESWIFSARVNDGTEWSDWYNSTPLVILNSAPTISLMSLTSSDGTNRTGADLNGNYTFNDIDNDSEANKETKWFKDNTEQGSLADLMAIAFGNTSKGEDWLFSAKVNDGTVWSSWYNSSILTIINAIPTAPSLNSPVNGVSFAVVKELNWTNSNDADGDSLTYRLELDDADTFTSLVYLNASITEDVSGITGDPYAMLGLNLADDKTYYWRVRANDGTDDSAWSDSWSFTYAKWNITFDVRDSYTNEQLSDVNITCNGWTNVDSTEELGVESGMVGLWHMNEASGSIIDSSVMGNEGTEIGGVIYGASGRFNTALDFDGSNDYVDFSDPNSLSFTQTDSQMTIALWMYSESASDTHTLVSKYDSQNSEIEYALFLDSANKELHFYVSDNGGTGTMWKTSTPNNVYTINEWQHIVVTLDVGTNTIKYYVNGIEQTTENDALSGITDMSNLGETFKIGTIRGSSGTLASFFDGKIDEVAIYNKTLSVSEVLANYEKGVPHYVYSDEFAPGNYDCVASKDADYYKKLKSFTADQDKIVTITMSQDEGLTEEEHTWLEALHECIIEEDCHLLNLLEQINQTVDAVWEVTKKTDETVVTSENVVSYDVNTTSNLTIDYTIDVPIKQGYSIGDYLPIRIGYWFMNSANTTCYNQGDKPTGVENPYCQPLITQTLGPMGGSTSFTVDLRPELPAGTYTIIRELDIDPNELWTNYGREAIGEVTIDENNEIASVSLVSDNGIESNVLIEEESIETNLQEQSETSSEDIGSLSEKLDSLAGITGNLAKNLQGKGSLFFTIGFFALITLIVGYIARRKFGIKKN